MTKFYWETDVDAEVLADCEIAILGYGSQGAAHAENLRESGFRVTLGLRPGGASWTEAERRGWSPKAVADAVRDADLIAFLLPDTAQPALFREQVAPNMKPGATLLFAHGFNIHYGAIEAPAESDVILVAPKSPGALVRRQYQAGRGVPCLIGVHQDCSGDARAKALAYAHGLGGTRAGVLETSFGEETETDLFGEQAVLCGGVTELVKLGFETLVEAGYQKEVAYFECLHELKLIVDLLYEGGFTRMHRYVSDTAKYGDLTRGPRVVDASARAHMREILAEIRDGRFAREWQAENEAGCPRYRELLAEDKAHPIEQVGRELRARMSWLREEEEALV